ncbi:MAG TPA: BON domain-containing protein [Candidatus Limnocylindria bacterium]
MTKMLEDPRRRSTMAGGAGARGRIMAALAGIGLGAAASYLLDPNRGRTRRARLGGQAAGWLRSAGRGLEHTTRGMLARAGGTAARLTHPGDGGPMPNDAATRDKVETELFRNPDVPQGDININVEQGVVVLRGQVPDEAMRDRLEREAARIPGVWSVRNLLHLPGEPAEARA